VAALVAISLTSCGAPREEAPEDGRTTDNGSVGEPADVLLLSINRAETAPDGRRCILNVTARNDTGRAALNVQVAWMAQTRGFGSISDYQMLGDFAAGEERALQLGVFGAPCDAVESVRQSRTVCTVEGSEGEPASCADRVILKDNRREGGT